MKTTLRTFLTLAVAALMMGSVAIRAEDGHKGGSGQGNNNQAAQVRLRTTLAGAAIQGKKPEGNGDFRSETGRTRLNVEVENVNLPAGTVLTVAIVHAGVSTTVGTITLGITGESELELEAQNGAMVPAIVSGDMVTVSNGASVILAGAF